MIAQSFVRWGVEGDGDFGRDGEGVGVGVGVWEVSRFTGEIGWDTWDRIKGSFSLHQHTFRPSSRCSFFHPDRWIGSCGQTKDPSTNCIQPTIERIHSWTPSHMLEIPYHHNTKGFHVTTAPHPISSHFHLVCIQWNYNLTLSNLMSRCILEGKFTNSKITEISNYKLRVVPSPFLDASSVPLVRNWINLVAPTALDHTFSLLWSSLGEQSCLRQIGSIQYLNNQHIKVTLSARFLLLIPIIMVLPMWCYLLPILIFSFRHYLTAASQ